MSDTKRTCVITGASAGIGKATAIEMARLGYSIVMMVRDSEKSRAAAETIRAESGSEDVQIVYVDLASRESITGAAEEMKRSGIGIDVLINNAGVYKRTRDVSSDGVEMTLAVNFVAPFMLTNLLVPLMEDRPGARIVNLSSEHYKSAKPELIGSGSTGKYNGNKTYATTKLLVVLWSLELAKRLQSSGITVNCLHPGVVGSDVFREYPKWFNTVLNLFISKPEEGAKPVVYLATSPEVGELTGEYFNKAERKPISGPAEEKTLWRQAWEYGEKLSAIG